MKKNVAIIVLLILTIYIMKQNHLLPLNIDELKGFISVNTKYALLLLTAIWIVMLLIFIRVGVLFILVGIFLIPMLSFYFFLADFF
ncbi:hypothetical protein PDN35_23615 [Bacillus cereus]|nr:hypothetical protein [Bacillus cereus]